MLDDVVDPLRFIMLRPTVCTALSLLLTAGCASTREVYLPPRPGEETWSWRSCGDEGGDIVCDYAPGDAPMMEVPAQLIAAGTGPAPKTLDEAYQALQWRCLGAEGERNTLTEIHGAGRVILIGLGIASTATATVLAGINDPNDPSLRGIPSRNLKWGTVFSAAVGTASAGALAAGSFDDRVDGNRSARKEIQLAMNEAAALWGVPKAKDEEKRKALHRMAQACNSTAYLERDLKSNGAAAAKPAEADASGAKLAAVQDELREVRGRLDAALVDPAAAADVAKRLRALGDRASDLQAEAAKEAADTRKVQTGAGSVAGALEKLLEDPAFKRLEADKAKPVPAEDGARFQQLLDQAMQKLEP